jgi:hypothetical protein
MLLAYIDEIGEPGAFVSKEHPRYSTSPAFGYAGFIIPSGRARQFGAQFSKAKNTLFSSEVSQAKHPGRFEKKGASIFRPLTLERYANQVRVFDSLVRKLRAHGGSLFYYADEKVIGTPKQVQLDPADVEVRAMRETLNRIARHADTVDRNIMVMIDQINEKTRADRLPTMYSHVLGRASDHPEMRRIVEPPMHIDSQLSSNIQFADWVAACITRALDYQLIKDSKYQWVTKDGALPSLRGSFTHESKLHLHNRSVADLNHSEIFKMNRTLYPQAQGSLMVDHVDPGTLRIIKAAAERASKNDQR